MIWMWSVCGQIGKRNNMTERSEGKDSMELDEILEIPPFSLEREQKQELLTAALKRLTIFHQNHCKAYGQILRLLHADPQNAVQYEELPFLPVRLFKEMDLRSVPKEAIVKTMTSSGTTGSAVSKIYLDKATAANQQKALVKIVADFTGRSRLPMLIIDSPAVIRDRRMFSARGAGILGFSILGSERKYALDSNMQPDWNGILEFLEKHRGKRMLVFGFTAMIWEHFYKRLSEQPARIDLGQAVLIHGGGWKKLAGEAVSPEEFRERLHQACGITEIYDYYGMVEQTGCIYMQCQCGHLHASVFSDVIVRRAEDFTVADTGEKGMIQAVSLLPGSYPGHSILTEDEGVILGEDDCPCGRKGKYFRVIGRIRNAEVRGCSDAYDSK